MDPLQHLCDIAASFFARGYAFGSTGNLSLAVDERVWITPTGASLRNLRPDMLAAIDFEGRPLNANKASKEFPFHLAAYRGSNGRAKALVHLHCTYSVALSCLDESMPVFTPYYLMRVAPLAVLPYFRPGSEDLAAAVGGAAAAHDSMLLRNHGVVCLGRSMDEAVDRAEELEETAKLWFLLRKECVRTLSPEQCAELERAFPKSRP
jgi:ribulose-5-phosphate 4-epimerase/fuculose-1-phosphate aldolase